MVPILRQIIILLIALLATILFELPVFILGYRKEDFTVKYKIIVFVLVNVITNLSINTIGLILRQYIYISMGKGMGTAVLILEETAVVVIEALVYKKAFITGFKKPLLTSLTANAISAIIGSYLINGVISLIPA